MDYTNISINILTKAFTVSDDGPLLNNKIVVDELKLIYNDDNKDQINTLMNHMSKIASVVMLTKHTDINVLQFDIKRVASDLRDYL